MKVEEIPSLLLVVYLWPASSAFKHRTSSAQAPSTETDLVDTVKPVLPNLSSLKAKGIQYAV